MDDATYERFMSKVEVLPNGCWTLTGKKNDNGYSYFWFEGKSRLAHRFIYKQMVGPIPSGLQVEHACHTLDLNCREDKGCPHRACVNYLESGHLEVLTARENVMRSRGLAAINAAKTHCVAGHELAESNTYLYPNGERGCRTCRTALWRDHRDRHNPGRGLPASQRTECPRGHPYDEVNTRVNGAGRRVCITCHREQDKLAKRVMRNNSSDVAPESVLHPVSLNRKACKRGHEWGPENTRFTGKRRVCLTCLDAPK